MIVINFFRALFRILYVVLGSLIFVYYSLIYFKFKGNNRENAFRLLQAWNKKIVKCLKIKIHIDGEFAKGKFVVMPNHRSYLDIFIMQVLFPSSMVGKNELKKWPILRLAIDDFYMIMVDRSNQKSRRDTLLNIKKELDAGGSVTLFPEGTTYEGPFTKKFNAGTFKLCVDHEIGIVPVALEFKDKNDSWIGKDTFVGHFFRQMGKKNTPVFLKVGEPMYSEDYKELMCKTKDWIDQSLKSIHEEIN